MYVHVCMYMCVYVHVCMCMCVYVHVCVCACVCMCMCVYVHVCACACVCILCIIAHAGTVVIVPLLPQLYSVFFERQTRHIGNTSSSVCCACRPTSYLEQGKGTTH